MKNNKWNESDEAFWQGIKDRINEEKSKDPKSKDMCLWGIPRKLQLSNNPYPKDGRHSLWYWWRKGYRFAYALDLGSAAYFKSIQIIKRVPNPYKKPKQDPFKSSSWEGWQEGWNSAWGWDEFESEQEAELLCIKNDPTTKDIKKAIWLMNHRKRDPNDVAPWEWF